MHSRRRILKAAGAAAVLTASPLRFAYAAEPGITDKLARYMVLARDTALPDTVITECKHRILDTFGAMVSVRG